MKGYIARLGTMEAAVEAPDVEAAIKRACTWAVGEIPEGNFSLTVTGGDIPEGQEAVVNVGPRIVERKALA